MMNDKDDYDLIMMEIIMIVMIRMLIMILMLIMISMMILLIVMVVIMIIVIASMLWRCVVHNKSFAKIQIQRTNVCTYVSVCARVIVLYTCVYGMLICCVYKYVVCAVKQ